MIYLTDTYATHSNSLQDIDFIDNFLLEFQVHLTMIIHPMIVLPKTRNPRSMSSKLDIFDPLIGTGEFVVGKRNMIHLHFAVENLIHNEIIVRN